jgi:cation diffusion facilitator family transporter
MHDVHDPYRQARKAAAWGIATNLALGASKLIGGLFGASLALLSDAVHSLVDAAISAALFGALVLAERPADREHPYGHARIEAVAGAGLAVLLILLAIGIAWEALATISLHYPAPASFTLAIAAGSALCLEVLFHYTSRVARRTGSAALMATAWDYRLDAVGSLAVLTGVMLARWGGPSWQWADHAAAVVVAATVLWVGAGLLAENVQSLIDRQADPELIRTVRDEALTVPGVLGVETLRVRKAGLEYLVDIHVEVDPEQSVRAGHEIAHAVKDRLICGVGLIRDVLVHVEPFSG